MSLKDRCPSFRHRLGKFNIAQSLLEMDGEQVLLDLFGQMIVVRCELRYELDAFEYIAMSPLFQEVPVGNVIPEYCFNVTVARVKDETTGFTKDRIVKLEVQSGMYGAYHVTVAAPEPRLKDEHAVTTPLSFGRQTGKTNKLSNLLKQYAAPPLLDPSNFKVHQEGVIPPLDVETKPGEYTGDYLSVAEVRRQEAIQAHVLSGGSLRRRPAPGALRDSLAPVGSIDNPLPVDKLFTRKDKVEEETEKPFVPTPVDDRNGGRG